MIFEFNMLSSLINLDTPFSAEGKEILALLRRKAPEAEVQPVIDRIHTLAATLALPEPLLASTDAYVTSICFIGSKSLSHVLSCIERCKERLVAIGATSETGRRQIITSVMAYWADQPGVGVNIIDKLLNYTILTPLSVIEWALLDNTQAGAKLAEAHVFEMVASTVQKVTHRVRQILTSRDAAGLPEDQKAILNETLQTEGASMRDMFRVMEEALISWATGSKDQAVEGGYGDSMDEELVRQWGQRWLRVFRRKLAVEEAFLLDAERKASAPSANGNGEENGHAMEVEVDV